MIIEETDLTREELCLMLALAPRETISRSEVEHRHRGHGSFRTVSDMWKAGGFCRDDGSRREAWGWKVFVEVKDGAQWRSRRNRIVATRRGLTNTRDEAEAATRRWRKRLASEHRASVENTAGGAK